MDWQSLRNPNQSGYQDVVCSLHWYHFNAQALQPNNAATDSDLHHAAEMQAVWKIPCLIGEFNFFGQPAAWTYGLQAYNRVGLNWTFWTYKNKGSGDNSWGLYTAVPRKVPPIPNLVTDSFEEISAKWKGWATSAGGVALNPMLGPVLKDMAQNRSTP